MNRKEIELEYDKKPSSSKPVEEPVRRRRGDVNKNRKYTCRPVFYEEPTTSSSTSIAKDGSAAGANLGVNTAASNNVSMMSVSSSTTSVSKSLFLKGFEKLHGHSLNQSILSQNQ